MTDSGYPGIRFPARAEWLDDFAGYRVFLEPWDPIAAELRSAWEAVAIRRESKILAIHGQQGAGKTLLTTKLVRDWEMTRDSPSKIQPDENNLWHRIVGGQDLSPGIIANATAMSALTMVDNTSDWLKGAISFMDGQGKRGCLHLADNAERTYFRQGLVDLTDSEYMNVNKESLNRMAAERLVASCRNELRGALLILLSNDALFLLSLAEEVERQHSGLLELAQLNLPDASTKETVIRVNTNRLNSSTYWASLDQSDAEDRRSVRLALAGEDSFPDSFKAVDAASKSRTGRPARRNVISLIVLTDAEDVQVFPIEELGSLKRTEVAESWLKMVTFEEDWAAKILDPRDATLLESEWVLRVCVIGNPFVRSILNVGEVLADEIHRSALERLLAQLKMYLGPGTHDVTRSGYSSDVGEIVSEWPGSDIDVQPFWSAGQSRSGLYEKGLRVVLPGYDSLFEGFLTYRPDYVVSAFRPCAISEAISDDEKAIRDAIKRAGHVFEFTAIANYSTNKVAEYLQEKLGNYVEVTQEQ